MAVVMEGGGWRRAHALVEAGSGSRDVLLQSSNGSNKSSDDSSKPSTSSTSGASTVVALGGGGGSSCGGGGGGVQQPSKKRGWGDVELQKALQLMLRQVPAAAAAAERETVDFLGVSGAPGWARAGEFLELDPANFPLPLGWEKCLDLRSGAVYFLNRATGEKTLADPRHPQLAVSSGLGLGLGLGSSAAAAVPAGTGGGTTTSYSRDAEADRNSDSPSPRWDRAIDSPSLFRTSSLTDEPAAPRPWALEHWAAAARGFSERTTTNPAPASAAGAASSDLRTVRWMHQQQQQPAVEEDSWRTQGLNSSCEVLDDGMVVAGGGSDLELKLSSCSSGLALAAEVRDDGRSVCTMEKVRQALLRSKAAPNAAASAPRWSGPARLQAAAAAQSPAAQQLFNNLRSSPASPCHSSSSASSSTPPSIHDLPVAVVASPPERCFRSCSPKVQPPLPSSSCYRAVSSPNCVSRTSSSNLSSPSHPASSAAGGHIPHPGSGSGSSFLSPNLASLKLASPSLSELERGASSQVLTLGGGGGAPSSSPANCGSGDMVVDCSGRDNSGNMGGGGGSGSMTLACCKNCLMYTLLAREDPRCPRCHKYVDVGFAPSGPHPQALQLLPPPLKKAKVELDL